MIRIGFERCYRDWWVGAMWATEWVSGSGEARLGGNHRGFVAERAVQMFGLSAKIRRQLTVFIAIVPCLQMRLELSGTPVPAIECLPEQSGLEVMGDE